MSYIYKIKNNINDKVYIGKTNKTIEERFKEHCRDCKKREEENRPLYRAMNKYGIENFSIEEIEECSPEILSNREKYWIEYYNSFKYGYNATKGGDGKSYLNYDLICKTYNKVKNLKETAKIIGCSEDSVHNILKMYNIKIISSNRILKERYGIKVCMKDKNTKKILKIFTSYSEAGQYLIDNKLSNCKLGTIRTHISEVCNGKRKSAAGFIWEKLQ